MLERLCSKKSDWSTRLPCGLTLSPPDAKDDDSSDSQPDDHDVPMATGVMPTLHPRPQLKFPKIPVQAM